jgi:hypothetical protein
MQPSRIGRMHSLANHVLEISVTYIRSLISLADESIRSIRDIRDGCIKLSKTKRDYIKGTFKSELKPFNI